MSRIDDGRRLIDSSVYSIDRSSTLRRKPQ
jgi:hypothetical protein